MHAQSISENIFGFHMKFKNRCIWQLDHSLTSIKWNLTWIPHLVSIMQIKKRRTWTWERPKEEKKKGSNHAIIILKILWKRCHRGNTIRTVSAVWKSAETIKGGTQLESRYWGRALPDGPYYDQLSFCFCLLIAFSGTTLFSTYF